MTADFLNLLVTDPGKNGTGWKRLWPALSNHLLDRLRRRHATIHESQNGFIEKEAKEMYENSRDEIQKIIKLVETCPEPLRAKAFEILLQGYVQTLLSSLSTSDRSLQRRTTEPPPPSTQQPGGTTIPSEVLPRLNAMAKRRKIAPDRLAALFDFSSDPVAFAPLNVEGANIKERTRKVALLVAARSFLTTGQWRGDWAEIKAMCTHQSCYDLPNFAATLKHGKGDLFKAVVAKNHVELTAKGTEQAELLLAELAETQDVTS